MEIVLGTYSCPFRPWRLQDGRLFDRFAFDTETTDIDDERPNVTPVYVLGAACNGNQGVFLTRETLMPFWRAHQDVPRIMHNAAFDLRVCAALLGKEVDVYADVEEGQVWDTLILNRLLSLATAGHTARGESSLANCVATHLGVTLPKEACDAQGKVVRTSFGQFLGKPPSAIPAEYLGYLGRDVIATWHLFGALNSRIREVLRHADGVFGFVDDSWLRDAVAKFGPLTHHTQLRASILMGVLRANGIGLDQARGEEKARRVEEVMTACKGRMRARGCLIGQAGSDKALQSILSEMKRQHPGLALKTTPSGKGWSTAQEDLAELAAEDSFFHDYLLYKAGEKLLSTYLRKMGRPRLHPKFGYLLETGRTYCGSGFNLQSLPKETGEKEAAATIRGCFVPGEGKVFIDCDYSQIELVTLGHALEKQFGWSSQLAALINQGQDVHRLIAAAVLAKPPGAVNKQERNSAKPVSFGRPGGMGAARLQSIARNNYGIDMPLDQVDQRIQAYEEMCPELTSFLQDEVDTGLVIAQTLSMTPAHYDQALGKKQITPRPSDRDPAGWLGGMLLKTLQAATPITQRGCGRPYSAEEIDYFWASAQQLPLKLDASLRGKLTSRQANPALWEAVRNWAGRRPVFTLTGRLRASATFCSSRNCIFQGLAADGAILGLWLVWRAGHKLVDFIHDQLVVESPADDRVHERAAEIESLMKQGMNTVVPGMRVQVETVITQSLHKADLDPRYQSHPQPKEENHVASCHPAA